MAQRQSPKANNTDMAAKLILFASLAFIAATVIEKIRVLLICVVLAIMVASALAPIAESAERKRIPRFATVLSIYAIAGLVYSVVGLLLVPAVIEQGQMLLNNLPDYIAGLSRWYHQSVQLIATNLPVTVTPAQPLSANDVTKFTMGLLRQTLGMSSEIVGLLLNSILVLLLAGCFVVEADNIWSGIFRWLPAHAESRLGLLIQPLSKRMGGYVRGQMLVAIAVGLFFGIGFSILGIKYALLLGVLAGTLNLVPYAGSVVALLCGLLVALSHSPLLAGGVLVLYALEQWIESTVLVPLLLGGQVALHPIIVLLALLFGTYVGGIPGALISVPLVSAGMLLAEEFYLKRNSTVSVKHSKVAKTEELQDAA